MTNAIKLSDTYWQLGLRIYHPDKPRDKWGHGVKLTKEEIKEIKFALSEVDPIGLKIKHPTEYGGQLHMDMLVRRGIDIRFLEMRETVAVLF